MGDENHHKLFSITVIGDHTPLMDAVADNPQGIELSLKESAGVDSIIKSVNLDGKIFKLQFFYFSGQRQFQFLQSKFKRHGIIIVYDATVRESFNRAETWLVNNGIPANGEEYRIPANGDNDVCMLLVGDDHGDNNVVETATGKELGRRFNIPFIEASANNPANLEQALNHMTKHIDSS